MTMIGERSFSYRTFTLFNYFFLFVLSMVCVLPLVHMAAVSLSDYGPVVSGRIGLWPVGFHLNVYRLIFMEQGFQRAFLVSVTRVLVGTTINLTVMSLTAYPLSLLERYPGKMFFKWMLIFAMLFGGGLIPRYLAYRTLGILDTLWVLVLPGAVSMGSILYAIRFFQALPFEITEAAYLDGASHPQILLRVILPLSKPILATLALFSAVGQWNAWFDGMIFIETISKKPLQTWLRDAIVISPDYLRGQGTMLTDLPIEHVTMRALHAGKFLLATIPIILIYPFLQRYFVTGLTLGSIKG